MEPLKLRPQPMSAEAFAPYGTLLDGGGQGAPHYGSDIGTSAWRVDLDVAKPLFLMLRTPPTTLGVTQLERHFNVQQTFLPLGGSAAALVVARPTRGDALPRPEDVTAFLLDGTFGYALHVGTWHSLDRLPVTKADTNWFMITHADTQADLANLKTQTAVHTQVIDLPKVWGTAIEISV